MKKVVKFGGSSLATAENVRKVQNIIESDHTISCIVVSAPGSRFNGDPKVTDLIYDAYRRSGGTNATKAYQPVVERFGQITSGLGMSGKQEEIVKPIFYGACESEKTALSHGEECMAKLIACLLKREYVEAADIIKFDDDGRLLTDLTYDKVYKSIGNRSGVVVAGFYGQNLSGRRETFARGGSDITGAILAAALDADVYENWTDVDGVMQCDPRVVKCAQSIGKLSFAEMCTLCLFGANVVHPDCFSHLEKKNIPVVVKNTFNPRFTGTVIDMCGSTYEEKPFFAIGLRADSHCDSIVVLRKTYDNTKFVESMELLKKSGIESLCYNQREFCDIICVPSGLGRAAVNIIYEHFNRK